MEESKKIRVAQIVGKTKLGGVSNCVLNYYKNIDKSKFEFDFFTYGSKKSKGDNTPSAFDQEVEKLGGKVYHIPNFINFFMAMFKLKKYLKAGNYDIVHSHLTSLSCFPLSVAKKCKINIRICHAHSTSYKYDWRTPIKNVLKRITRLYATNYLACGQKTAEWMYGNKYGEALVIPNAIDFDKFRYDVELGKRFKDAYGISDRPVVGFAGRFVYQKNMFFLLKVFREVVKLQGNVTLLLCGNGKLQQRIEKKIVTLGLTNNVKIVDCSKEPNLIVAAYNAMDVFCLPSRFEGLPLSAIEAAACGVPGIYSDKITDEIKILNNMLLSTKKPKLWATVIARTIKHRESSDAKKVGAQRLLLQESGYMIGKSAQILQDYYLGCMEEENNELTR